MDLSVFSFRDPDMFWPLFKEWHFSRIVIPAKAGIQSFLDIWMPPYRSTGQAPQVRHDEFYSTNTNQAIIEKTYLCYTTPTNSHPPPDLPLEGGGNKRFPSLSGGGIGWGWGESDVYSIMDRWTD